MSEKLEDIIAIPTKEQPVQQNEVIIEEGPGADTDTDNGGGSPEKETELDDDAVELGADVFIGMYDIGQQKLLAHFGKRRRNKKLRKTYGENSLEKLEQLKNEIDALHKNKMQQTIIREFTPDDYGMLRVEKAFEEYMDDLPLTDDEKDLIRKPLMKLMIKRGGEIPAELALGLAVLQISGSRVAEMYML